MYTPRPTKIAKGGKFLPNTTMAYLKECHKRETNPRSRDRLLSYMQRKEGVPMWKIAENLNVTKGTIFKWLDRAQQEGIRGRHEKKGRGRKSKLSESQEKELKADLDAGPESCEFESGVWDSNLVRSHIQTKFGVQYSKSGVAVLLKRLGFSWTKARSKNPKSASKRKQNEFKEDSQELIREKTKEGFTAMTADAATIQKACNKPFHGWRRRGRRNTTPSFLSRQKRHMFGALAAGIFFFMFYDKTNSESFIDFLGELHKKFGKVLLFVDNAAYHKSEAVKKFLEECNGDILLEYLPPYTPELNPVEIQWRMIKRALSSKIFRTLDEIEDSVHELFNSGEVKPVKIFQYLMG